VRRELDNLTKLGLLSFKKVDQKLFYLVNNDFILLGELTALIKKSQSLIERIVQEKLKKLDGLRYVALTGRFVDDESLPTDVLLVGRITNEALLKFIKDLERFYQKEIRYTHLTSREFNIRKDLTDKFLYSILNGKKIILLNKLGI
jgi:predicted nucleotidyltransferase